MLDLQVSPGADVRFVLVFFRGGQDRLKVPEHFRAAQNADMIFIEAGHFQGVGLRPRVQHAFQRNGIVVVLTEKTAASLVAEKQIVADRRVQFFGKDPLDVRTVRFNILPARNDGG